MKTLWLIRGLPGSGKSTLGEILSHALKDAYQYEADEYFQTRDGYKFDAGQLDAAHDWCINNCLTAMRDYKAQNVIICNVFALHKQMEVYESMAAMFGYDVQKIIMQGNFGSIHGVPAATIARMKARFEV